MGGQLEEAGGCLPVPWEWKNPLSRELWLCACRDGAAGAELAPRGHLGWLQPPAPALASLSQGDTGACRVLRDQHRPPPPKPRTPQSPGTAEQGGGGKRRALRQALGGTTRDVTSVTPRSSGRALRRCQAGSGRWAASEVQGRTGTAGDVLGARQHAEPQRGRTERRRLCAARRQLGRVSGYWRLGAGCRWPHAARLAQHLQLHGGVCSKRAAGRRRCRRSRRVGTAVNPASPLPRGPEVWSGAGAKPELRLPGLRGRGARVVQTPEPWGCLQPRRTSERCNLLAQQIGSRTREDASAPGARPSAPAQRRHGCGHGSPLGLVRALRLCPFPNAPTPSTSVGDPWGVAILRLQQLEAVPPPSPHIWTDGQPVGHPWDRAGGGRGALGSLLPRPRASGSISKAALGCSFT